MSMIPVCAPTPASSTGSTNSLGICSAGATSALIVDESGNPDVSGRTKCDDAHLEPVRAGPVARIEGATHNSHASRKADEPAVSRRLVEDRQRKLWVASLGERKGLEIMRAEPQVRGGMVLEWRCR